jgi:hypothetical protein
LERASLVVALIGSIAALVTAVVLPAIVTFQRIDSDVLAIKLLDFNRESGEIRFYVDNSGDRPAVFRDAEIHIPIGAIPYHGRASSRLSPMPGSEQMVLPRSAMVLTLMASQNSLPNVPVASPDAVKYLIEMSFLGAEGVQRDIKMELLGVPPR